MTEEEKKQLDEQGYLVLEDFMDREWSGTVRQHLEELFADEGDQAGSEFRQEPGARRLANLVGKGKVFERVILTPEILECMAHVLGSKFKLSSLNARAADPHSDCTQPLHADVGAVADEKGYWVCNAVWMLDRFSSENGAIRLVPGSHRWKQLPEDVMQDVSAPHPDEAHLTGSEGTVVIMNAHLWHGAMGNRTSGQRRALHTFYTRWDKPQQQYQKQLIPLEIQQRFSPELRRILALDDPLNDELSSQSGRPSGFLK